MTLDQDDHRLDWHGFLGRDGLKPLPGLQKQAYSKEPLYRKAVLAGRGIAVGNKVLLSDDFAARTFRPVCADQVHRNRYCIAAIPEGYRFEGEAKKLVSVLREIFKT